MKTRLLLLAALLSASAALAQDRLPSASLPTCTDGDPWDVVLVDASTTTDCNNVGGSTVEAWCCCRDGAIAACLTSTSSNSFATMNAPSGTDPVASSSSDTLNFTAAGGLSITGNSGTKTLAFDFASSSFTPAVSAPAVDAVNGVWTIANGVMFEGATADTFEMQLFSEDLTADRFIQLPNMTGYVQLSDCATCYGGAANSVTVTTNGLLLEGTTNNAFETSFLAGDPTADRTITLPDNTGTVLTTASNYAASVSAGGPATTATALVTNPADCSTSDGTEAAWRINASGDLSCTTIQVNYGQYDPNNPPASCAVCDEFTSGTTLTWNTTDGLDGGSATSEFGGYTLAHSGTNETMVAWTNSPSSGNIDFTVTVKVLQSGTASTDGCGIAFLAAGTTAAPTDIRQVYQQTGTGFGFVVGNVTSYTAAPTAASTETAKVSTVTLNTTPTYLQARYIDSTRAITGWFSYDGTHFYQIGASSTTASADPSKWGLMMRDDPTCVFAWARARTDANKNYAGE